eukprot:scaffold3735_cov367-Prasinococcus_capsulatus_cf.AAC.3
MLSLSLLLRDTWSDCALAVVVAQGAGERVETSGGTGKRSFARNEARQLSKEVDRPNPFKVPDHVQMAFKRNTDVSMRSGPVYTILLRTFPLRALACAFVLLHAHIHPILRYAWASMLALGLTYGHVRCPNAESLAERSRVMLCYQTPKARLRSERAFQV